MSDWQNKLPRFIYLEPFREGASLRIEGPEAHHLSTVVRLSVGDEITLIDGRGLLGRATILASDRKRVEVKVTETCEIPQTARVNLCLGISKGTALESAIRHCTALGIKSLRPLETQHSLPATSWNAARWERIVQDVSKQCQAALFAEIHDPVDLATFLQARNPKSPLIFCNETERKKRDTVEWGEEEVDLLVGPEGGWSELEIEAIKKSRPLTWGLGPNRLRVETASVVVLTLVKEQLGELT